MIGVYNYTVILTYLSLISAIAGIVVTLSGASNPYLGVFFLLLCGLLDSFDGKVARTKKNRTDEEKSFGIQIDSLSDLVAFGVLPACIGVSCLRTAPFAQEYRIFESTFDYWYLKVIIFAIIAFYVLAALIRLAHFNVTEELRSKTEGGVRKSYTGLPVTNSALIFPSAILLQYVFPFDLSLLYVAFLLITALCFLLKFNVPKFGLRGILVLVGIGVAECVAFIVSILSR